MSIPVRCKSHRMLPNCGSARQLCRCGATRPGEAGGREVESSPQGVGTAGRSGGSAQVRSLDCRKASIYKYLIVDTKVERRSIYMWMLRQYLQLDACI